MNDIPPIQRVAAFLLSLEPATAARVLTGMPDDVVERVSEAMTELDDRAGDAKAVDDVYLQLAKRLHGPVSVRSVEVDELEAVLGASFGAERAAAMVAEIRHNRRLQRPFAALEANSTLAIARVLGEESDSVTSLVLNHLDPEVAAGILAKYDPTKVTQIVKRMALAKAPAPETLAMLADDLAERARIAEADGVPTSAADRMAGIAKVLNFSSAQFVSDFIKNISEEDEAMAAELRDHMFTWDDISTVDKRNMQKILGTVDTKTLSIALKASNREVEKNVLSNLSERVREMVKEEREMAGAMSMNEVQAAREEIMTNVRALIESGEFTPARSGEDLVV